jgi:hercynine metabolism small protein
MSREEQRQAMRATRENLIAELEELYHRAFDRLGNQQLGEGAIARLTQLLLRSREAAITPLREEIEAPLITTAPGTGEAATPASAPGASAP